jgi:hypothetical protein
LLYVSIGGGIFLTICAVIFVPLTAGLAAFVLWPISMVWAVVVAIASKSQKSLLKLPIEEDTHLSDKKRNSDQEQYLLCPL